MPAPLLKSEYRQKLKGIEMEDLSREMIRAFRDSVVGQIKGVACVAEIEGMKAENQQRLQNGQSVAYGDDAFQVVSDTLTKIAIQLQEIIF